MHMKLTTEQALAALKADFAKIALAMNNVAGFSKRVDRILAWLRN